MNMPKNVQEALLAAMPNLRAYAISLSGNVDRADDLVQETILLALAHIDSFEPGTNMGGWLFTILRNLFRTQYQKRRREVEDADGSYAATLTSAAVQEWHLVGQDIEHAVGELNSNQASAFILVKINGHSYEDAAKQLDVPVGTVKSRVNRANYLMRKVLVEELPDPPPKNRAAITQLSWRWENRRRLQRPTAT